MGSPAPFIIHLDLKFVKQVMVATQCSLSCNNFILEAL